MMEKEFIPAIVIGAHTMGLGVIRSLGKMGVPVIAVSYDPNDMGQGSKYVKETFFAPHPEEQQQEFIKFLLGLAEKYQGSIVFPVSDASLMSVSANKPLLEPHFIIACEDHQVNTLIIEKKYTYELADSLGIPAPKTLSPTSIEEGIEYGKRIGFPCVVKPSQSHLYFDVFGKKMVKVQDEDQLKDAVQEAFEAELEIFIQEFIPGDDSHTVNYNSYFWDSQPLVEFTAQQIRKAPPTIGAPCVVISKDILEIRKTGSQFMQGLGFNGYSCMELKLDAKENVYKLVEVNGRHNLSTMLAVSCGINFPWLHYKHLVWGELPGPQDFETGKYWIDLTRDLFTALKHPKILLKLGAFLKPYFSPKVFAILDIRDIKPFWLRLVNNLKSSS